MTDDPLKRMRERVEQCRRLAEHVSDPKTVAILKQMADEAEADLKRLVAERNEEAD